MTREEEVHYKQDQKGNEAKAIDEIRGQSGMNGEGTDGLISVSGGQASTDLQFYEVPDGAEGVRLSYLMATNTSGGPAEFTIKEADLSSGTIDGGTVVDRSVPIQVADSATRTLGYEGDLFTKDVVVVNANAPMDIGASFYPEYNEG